jgi:hypothetical protein
MQNEVTGNTRNGIASDIAWLTYAELGRARGISADSAKRLATRRHWRRQQDNDGTTRVAVPVTEAAQPEASVGNGAMDVTDLVATIEAAHSRELGTLRERVDAAEQARAAAQTLAEQSLALVAVERGRAERAETSLAAERTRADWLRGRLDEISAKLSDAQRDLSATQNELTAAKKALTEARDLEAAKKAHGRLARLGAAWRGDVASRPMNRQEVKDSDRHNAVKASFAAGREKAERKLRALLQQLRQATKRRPPGQ